MKTDVLTIQSNLYGKDAAMETAEKFADFNGLTGRSAMHIRLLTEETISMLHGILDDFKGDFWIESEKNSDGLLCRICVSAKKSVDDRQEDSLLSVATSGKNENARGILGKIREIIRWSVQKSDISNVPADAWFNMGIEQNIDCWSLQQYRSTLSPSADTEEWDELEKSIIANIADEVKVWLKDDSTDIVIEKSFRL